MDMIRLIEDLERLQFKLQVEAEMSDDAALAKRLADLAVETNDAVLTAKSLPQRINPEPDPALN